MHTSSVRRSARSQLWRTAREPRFGVLAAILVVVSATAGLVALPPGATGAARLAVRSTPIRASVATVSPHATVAKNGLVTLTIQLTHATELPVTVTVIAGGQRREVTVPAGQSSTTVKVPMWSAKTLPVQLTSYDVTTMNGVVNRP